MDLRHHWKEAANLLLITPSTTVSDETDCDYSVLTVRGNRKNDLQSRSFVTPGGTLDSSDFSYKWWQLFEKFHSNSDSVLKRLSGFVSSRPPIITDNIMFEELRRSSCEEEYFVWTDIALRIAAIRHLFVQTGILLVEPMNNIGLTSDICDKWRQKVTQNPYQLVEMCFQLDLRPDLSSLKEWWNWLTPSSVGRSPRFDTIYYICFVNKPIVNECQHWSTPRSLIERKEREGYFLAPPQVYEFSRLLNFKTINELEAFATKRERHGIERWSPVLSIYSNGTISVLPGDELYPTQVELIQTKPVRTYPQSLEEIRRKSIRLNRMELKGTDCQVVVNTDMPLRHVSPVPHYSQSITAQL